MCFVILIPACLNLYAQLRFATPQGIELTIRQCQEMNSYWDKPKDEAFQAFSKTYPEWKDTPPVTKRFAWKWYYAMHQAGDDSVLDLSDRYMRSLKQRQLWPKSRVFFHRLSMYLSCSSPWRIQGYPTNYPIGTISVIFMKS